MRTLSKAFTLHQGLSLFDSSGLCKLTHSSLLALEKAEQTLLEDSLTKPNNFQMSLYGNSSRPS